MRLCGAAKYQLANGASLAVHACTVFPGDSIYLLASIASCAGVSDAPTYRTTVNLSVFSGAQDVYGSFVHPRER